MAQLLVVLCFVVVLAISWVECRVARTSGRNAISNPLNKRVVASPQIPEHCKKTGFCLDVPNYPTGDIENLLKGLGNSYVFQNDTLEKELADRISDDSDGSTINFCNSTEKILNLKVAKNKDDEWQWVVNVPLQSQGFRAEICHFLVNTKISATEKSTSNTQCDSYATFGDYSDAVCQQSYGYRTAVIMNKEKLLDYDQILVPTCCSCVPQGLKLP